jgi:hypothetical protein
MLYIVYSTVDSFILKLYHRKRLAMHNAEVVNAKK